MKVVDGDGEVLPPGEMRSAGGLLRGAAGLARVAVSSSWRLAAWTAGASVTGTTYVVRRTLAGEPPGLIVQEAAQDLRDAARRALGLAGPLDGTERVRAANDSGLADLRRRGADLMRRSNDIHVVDDTHPAFARILSEITPDEARILRFLYLDGPQPSIDVRTNRPLGIGSELVAGGLNMIAEHAGCRHVEHVGPYLTNLARLGLVEFSKEQVSNPQRYQVVEAQPKVNDALRRAGRMPRIVHRSILLTDFGVEFCRSCLPLDEPRPYGGRRPRPS